MKKSPAIRSTIWQIRNRESEIINTPSLVLLAACSILALTTGCQVLSYSAPTGERFSRSSLGANTSIQSLAFEAGTNGVRRLELRGYNNDNSQALGAVTEAAVRAALQSAK